MSGRIPQLAFASLYLTMLCLALSVCSGCSGKPTPAVAPPVTSEEPVKLKVELGESNGSQFNSTVTMTGRELEKTVITDEYGTTEITLKYRPGDKQASERETRYSGVNSGSSLTVEKLNSNGKPRELKTWCSKGTSGGSGLLPNSGYLFRHAIFMLNGKVQWQEFYDANGSVLQRTICTKDGGFEELCFDGKGQAWLLRYNKDDKVAERFDYYGDERSQVKCYVKWDPRKEFRRLESRTWYPDGTLECERKLDDNGFNHVRWYRKNGVLKIAEKQLDNEDRGMDVWEDYYKPDGKTVWRKSTYVHRVRTNYQLSETGVVEVISSFDCKTGDSTITQFDPKGRKVRELEWKRVKIRSYDGTQFESAQMVRADTMDQEGRLASRFLYDLEKRCLRELQIYRNGALAERKILDDKACVIRIEAIAADGTVARATEVAEEDRKPLSEDERYVEYIHERSYDVDETMPDHCVDHLRSK